MTSPADIPSAIGKRGLKEIPILGDLLGLPNTVIAIGISAFAAMAGASLLMGGGESPGAAAAAKEATAARAARKAAASEAAAHEDFKYRKTSELVQSSSPQPVQWVWRWT